MVTEVPAHPGKRADVEMLRVIIHLRNPERFDMT